MEGKVKFYDSRKGFGFIVGTDDREYFVHVSSLPTDTQVLSDDQAVSFQPEEGERGPVAKSVTMEVK